METWHLSEGQTGSEQTGSEQTGSEQPWDVVVVGAGIAGLAAARLLAEAGRRVLVLEAQAQVGGRIRTVRQDGVAVELGAEFVHGRPPELLAVIEEAKLATYERTGAMLTAANGQIESADWDAAGEDGPLEQLKQFAGPDCSFTEYLDRLGIAGDERTAALGYAEGYNAATAGEASAMALGLQQRAEDEIEGDRVSKFHGGYDRLPAYVLDRLLAAGGQLRLSSPVDTIAWSPGQVRVLAGGQEFRAAQCVITLPLGVLQASASETGAVRFSPEPGEILAAAARMRMGPVFRMSLLFRERLWPEEMSFLFARERTPPVWWTSHPDPTPLLTAWAGGSEAAGLLSLTGPEQVAAVTAALAEALGLHADTVRGGLLGAHFHDWQADPYARGAYSWVPVGGLGASERMAQPVEDTLFFAGEHTDTSGHWGTVHAALGSGLRAAQQLLGTAGQAVANGRRNPATLVSI